MSRLQSVAALLGAFAATSCAAAPSLAADYEVGGPLVSVAVEVDGETTALHPSRDGTKRVYFEARAGARYAVRLRSLSASRLAVAVVVDGLDAISGRAGRANERMYVLDPWSETLVRGWRRSLSEVQSFVFVDEGQSYAARSGQMNGKVGWIEIAVYRERSRPVAVPAPRCEKGRTAVPSDQAQASSELTEASPSSAGEAARGSRPRSYPGTGWGEALDDGAYLVEFEAESTPSQRVTLRYEYAPALRALGILPAHPEHRLSERERGDHGFALPPRY
jgi:hypothetical protein